MGDSSAIQWTDATWNPVTGCSKVSPGCANCYAETLTRRFSKTWGVPDLPWTPENAEENVIPHPERLKIPLKWQRPRMVFVNSMSDLFHELVPDEFIARVFGVMGIAERHTFQVLTKRPERMAALLGDHAFRAKVMLQVGRLPHQDYPAWPLPNVWLGTSIENRKFVGRADVLRETLAAVRFISAEPLLGPLFKDYEQLLDPCGETHLRWSDGSDVAELDLEGIDWLIVGGESGPGHRPMSVRWARDLRDACLAQRTAGRMAPPGWAAPPPVRGMTALFFKQWGGVTPKAGGRELDGRTWDEMPKVVSDGPLKLI